MWKPKSGGWGSLGRRLWRAVNEDDLFGQAAKLAYYFVLSVVPLLVCLITALGFFARDAELRGDLLSYLSAFAPASASALIYRIVEELSQQSGGGKLSIGILATLWAASSGMAAAIESLNVAYDVKETRPWWRVRLAALILTVGLSLAVIFALVLLLYGSFIGNFISNAGRLGRPFLTAWNLLQWPVIGLTVFAAFAALYRYGPNARGRRPVCPGAVLGVMLWFLVSFGLRAYLMFFDSYSVTYGSLGAVIILMLWFYLSGIAILIGGEYNAEMTKKE
jgi:membrane protein